MLGLDLVEDEAQQRLALTDRVWVPPMNYKSHAPYAQLSWDIGPVTVSGGMRQENGSLHVDDYTTSFFRNSVFVQGGGVDYKENLSNLGAIWRITDTWSVFASYGEGFGLPNIGIPLRNISVPGQSVDRIADLGAIVVKNTEFGFNYRGSRGSLSGSSYHSKSPFGASLSIDPATNDFILTRAPVDIKGIEFSGDYRLTDTVKVTALYSRIRGYTAFFLDGGLHRPIGVLDINPDKFGGSVIWNYLPQGELTFGFTKLFDRHLENSQVRTNANGSTTNFSYNEQTRGYVLFDLSVNYQTRDIGKFTLGVENVFDKQYILSWSQVPGFQNYWAGRGRMISLSYQYTF
jgi:iron complex outermembrane receptor protein